MSSGVSTAANLANSGIMDISLISSPVAITAFPNGEVLLTGSADILDDAMIVQTYQ